MKGPDAEKLAAEFLQQQGLQLLAHNYRSRFGEIDLIMQDGSVLVFVEVRQRSRADYGGAAASIDVHKQRKLISTAQHYLAQLHHTPPCRFDALLIDDAAGCHVQWLKNAFDA
ncbi:MAG: YraN family protein [Nitrosomonadales bacterium]